MEVGQDAILTEKQQERYAQVLGTLEHLGSASVPNRRILARTHFCRQFWATVLAAPGTPHTRVHTRNLSPQGAAFVCSHPFAWGERFVLHLEMPGYPPKLVLARALHTRPVDGGLHEIGAEFLASHPGKLGDPLPAEWLTSQGEHNPNSKT